MITKRKIVYIVTSVFFSSLLFVIATSVNFQNNSSARQVSSETYTNTLTNIPIDVKYDDSKYFVSGISSEVTVFLNGSNRVALASEMQSSTRKFKVVADLSNLKEGEHEITLEVEGLLQKLVRERRKSLMFPSRYQTTKLLQGGISHKLRFLTIRSL